AEGLRAWPGGVPLSRRATPRGGPGASTGSARRNGLLLPLVPRAERDPLGAIGRELLRPHGDELATLPLQHVVLHARIAVLAGVVELHAPAIDPGADRQVQRHDRAAELVEGVGLCRGEAQLPNPHTTGGECAP